MNATATTWPVFGHDWAVQYLTKGLIHRRVRHAYLIVGPRSIGKWTLAHAFAMALNCEAPDVAGRPCLNCPACKKIQRGSHTDLIYSETDATTGTLKIDAVRGVARLLAMKPYEGRYRVAIMDDFHMAAGPAQDALLKTLEEPPPHAVLILLATSGEPILSTITSRSQVIRLRPVARGVIRDVLMAQYNLDAHRADQVARFSGGRIGWAIEAAQNPEALEIRDEALDLLIALLGQPRRGRFDLAASLQRDAQKNKQERANVARLLELWLTFWRDLVLHLSGGDVPLTNIDRQAAIQQLAYDVTLDDALKAVHATQQALDRWQLPLNLRLALETLFLAYPGLAR